MSLLEVGGVADRMTDRSGSLTTIECCLGYEPPVVIIGGFEIASA